MFMCLISGPGGNCLRSSIKILVGEHGEFALKEGVPVIKGVFIY